MFGLIKQNAANEYVFNNLFSISQVADRVGEFSFTVDRANIKLFVLDDEGFNSDPLISIGYKNITKCTKFENADYFSSADIILCDIDGIGGDLDPSKQGLAVAENLKKIFPQKIVMIYTSKNIESYGDLPQELDGLIRKQCTMSDLAFELDNHYSKSKDVLEVWKNIQQEMISNNIATKTIAFTEHYYCKSLLEKCNLFNDPNVNSFVTRERIEKFAGILSDIIKIFASVL